MRGTMLRVIGVLAFGCSLLVGCGANIKPSSSPGGPSTALPQKASPGYLPDSDVAVFFAPTLFQCKPATTYGWGPIFDMKASAPTALAQKAKRFYIYPPIDDVIGRSDYAQLETDWLDWIHTAQADGVQVVLTTIPKMYGIYDGKNAEIDRINALTLQEATKANTWVVDLASVLKDSSQFVPQYSQAQLVWGFTLDPFDYVVATPSGCTALQDAWTAFNQ